MANRERGKGNHGRSSRCASSRSRQRGLHPLWVNPTYCRWCDRPLSLALLIRRLPLFPAELVFLPPRVLWSGSRGWLNCRWKAARGRERRLVTSLLCDWGRGTRDAERSNSVVDRRHIEAIDGPGFLRRRKRRLVRRRLNRCHSGGRLFLLLMLPLPLVLGGSGRCCWRHRRARNRWSCRFGCPCPSFDCPSHHCRFFDGRSFRFQLGLYFGPNPGRFFDLLLFLLFSSPPCRA